LTILNKETCLGVVSGFGGDPGVGDVSGRLSVAGVDPVVALRLRNPVDYRLPTLGPHGTKLDHS
jgi:hypothetical protein